MTRAIADLLLLISAAIWGLSFIFQKTAMASLEPLTFIAARAAVAAFALLPLAAIETHRNRGSGPTHGLEGSPGLLGTVAVAGVVFLIAAALQQYGLVTATASNGGFLTALYVVLTPPLAWALRGNRPGPLLVPAALLSAVGTWMLGGGSFAALSVGDWLLAGCAVFWALHVIICSAGAAFDRPLLFTALQFLIVAVLAGAGAALIESPRLAGLLAARGEILYVGLLSSALTFTILTFALKYTPASEAAVLVSTECLFASAAGALLLGERLSPLAWIGAGLILTGVVAVQIRPSTVAT